MPGWQQLIFSCFLIPLLLSVLCEFFCCCCPKSVFLVCFLRLNIFVPLFYTKTGHPVLWIEEESVVRFSDTSSDFEGPFLRLVTRFIIQFVYVTGLITSVTLVTVISEPEGDLIFLLSGIYYIPPARQTFALFTQTKSFKR
ncbi:hypothetical protein M9H77_26724 [Catharanthus roseus]|uniref:Uncharacterized protein n=1 Tax=Catharanthus roseus TaxID=4058 RepID=A0ACC0AEJ9_CATRO|nr:hypothetical protein M9H77_26724 [Catharanthus roseus]